MCSYEMIDQVDSPGLGFYAANVAAVQDHFKLCSMLSIKPSVCNVGDAIYVLSDGWWFLCRATARIHGYLVEDLMRDSAQSYFHGVLDNSLDVSWIAGQIEYIDSAAFDDRFAMDLDTITKSLYKCSSCDKHYCLLTLKNIGGENPKVLGYLLCQKVGNLGGKRGKYLVVVRVAVASSYQKQGICPSMLEYVSEMCEEAGYTPVIAAPNEDFATHIFRRYGWDTEVCRFGPGNGGVYLRRSEEYGRE